MKIFNVGVYELKDIGNRFRNCFVEHILDAVVKHEPVGFLYILGIQDIISSVFSFSMILKPRRLVYSVFYYLIPACISFAASVISMSNNAYFIQYHFNIIPFAYNSNIVGCFIN